MLSFSSIFQIDVVKATETYVYVDDDNTAGPWDGTANHPFQYIQNGINAATENQTVYVLNGTYCENVIINKTINLTGDDKINTTIDGCGNENAVYVTADEVIIRDFTIENSTNGIKINGSSNTTVTENTITDTDYGIYVENSSNNTLYHNNFLNNVQNAYDKGNNTWDNGYPSGGNYWSDYTGNDANSDGIGDTPYNISGGDNQDRYPLIEPITELPQAVFLYQPTTPTTQNTIQFTDSSTDPDGYIASWSWSFGDGNSSTEQNPTHQYVDNGAYNVTLSINDNYGASASTSQQINVLNVAPTAGFVYSPDNPTDLQEVNFTDTSSDLDGNIVNWTWDFGDGNLSYLQNPLYRYADNGTYTITLTVTDDDGAKGIASQHILILNAAPSANFVYSPTNPTTNDTLRFTDISRDNDGTIIARFWNFGASQSFENRGRPQSIFSVFPQML